MYMDVELVELLRIDADLVGAGLGPREGRLRGLLHNISELSGQEQRTLPRCKESFYEENVAARGGPREARRYAHLILLQYLVRVDVRDPQKIVQGGRRNADERGIPLGYAPGDFTRDGRNLALELAQPGLVRVLLDDGFERGATHRHVPRRDAVRLHLLRDNMPARDLGFLFFGIAGQADDFHSIPKRGVNRLKHVCSRHEHDVRQIERRAEVIVSEGEILLGVEHFEERRGRISPEIRAHLIYFI